MTLSASSPADGEAAIPNTLVLDACVLLNLYASGCAEAILASLPTRNVVSVYAARETLWYLQRGDPPERRDISLKPLIALGLIEVENLTAQEQSDFVRLAHQLGDGEAASGALAITRSAAVATDDRKARQVFAQQSPRIRVVGTSTLLRSWETRAAVSRAEVRAAVRAIDFGARFRPAENDSHVAWWRDRLRGESPG